METGWCKLYVEKKKDDDENDNDDNDIYSSTDQIKHSFEEASSFNPFIPKILFTLPCLKCSILCSTENRARLQHKKWRNKDGNSSGADLSHAYT